MIEIINRWLAESEQAICDSIPSSSVDIFIAERKICPLHYSTLALASARVGDPLWLTCGLLLLGCGGGRLLLLMRSIITGRSSFPKVDNVRRLHARAGLPPCFRERERFHTSHHVRRRRAYPKARSHGEMEAHETPRTTETRASESIPCWRSSESKFRTKPTDDETRRGHEAAGVASCLCLLPTNNDRGLGDTSP